MLQTQTPRLPPPTPLAVIFESCPGAAHISGTMAAMTDKVPNRLAKTLIMATSLPLYMAMVTSWLVTRGIHPITYWRNMLADPQLVPGIRTYIYSKTDRVVPREAVESHAALAIANGVSENDVRLEMFDEEDGSPAHLGCVKSNPERYWSVVRQAWEDACRVASRDGEGGAGVSSDVLRTQTKHVSPIVRAKL